MKKIINKYSFIAAIGMFCLTSCTDLIATYDDYQGTGEIQYAGKVDSLRFKEGFERLQLEGYLFYTKRSKSLVLEWNDLDKNKQQKIVDIASQRQGDTIRVLIENLKEGIYTFDIYTLDKNNVKSVIDHIQAQVFGEGYLASLKAITYEIVPEDESNEMVIDWASIPKLSYIKLTYKNANGEPQEQKIMYGTKQTKLVNYEVGGKLSITSYHKPSENALDYIALAPEIHDLLSPLNRQKFTDQKMPSDAAQNHGGLVPNLWDGNTESYMHTDNNVGVPSHITLDTGAKNNLTSARVKMRNNFIWCPFQFQIWGLEDVANINDHEPSVADNFDNRVQWERESLAKGWINLTTNNYTNYAVRPTNQHDLYFTLSETNKKIRYIRYRAVKVWEREGNTSMTMEGGNAYFCASELYLYAAKPE